MAMPREVSGQFRCLLGFLNGEAKKAERYYAREPGKLAEKRREMRRVAEAVEGLKELPPGSEHYLSEIRLFLEDKRKHFGHLKDPRWKAERLEAVAGAARALAAIEEYWKGLYPELQAERELPQPWYQAF